MPRMMGKTILPETLTDVLFGVFKISPRPPPTKTVIPGEITPETPVGPPPLPELLVEGDRKPYHTPRIREP